MTTHNNGGASLAAAAAAAARNEDDSAELSDESFTPVSPDNVIYQGKKQPRSPPKGDDVDGDAQFRRLLMGTTPTVSKEDWNTDAVTATMPAGKDLVQCNRQNATSMGVANSVTGDDTHREGGFLPSAMPLSWDERLDTPRQGQRNTSELDEDLVEDVTSSPRSPFHSQTWMDTPQRAAISEGAESTGVPVTFDENGSPILNDNVAPLESVSQVLVENRPGLGITPQRMRAPSQASLEDLGIDIEEDEVADEDNNDMDAAENSMQNERMASSSSNYHTHTRRPRGRACSNSLLSNGSAEEEDDDDLGVLSETIPMKPAESLPPSMSRATTLQSPARVKSHSDDDDDDDDNDFAVGFEEEEDDDDEDNALLRHSSSQNLLHHHRMPSTIVEEFTMAEDDDDDSVHATSPAAASNGSLHQAFLVNTFAPQFPSQLPSPGRRGNSFDDSLSQDSTGGSGGGDDEERESTPSPPTATLLRRMSPTQRHGSSNNLSEQQHQQNKDMRFTPFYTSTRVLERVSHRVLRKHYSPMAAATWIGFWALFLVTCANYVLTPMRDAIALQVGVQHMPKLTLASTVLAFCSSVPIGWLFEAPDPSRRRLWKRMGLTRGETQGTSLALFYRCFALILLSYAVGFQMLELLSAVSSQAMANDSNNAAAAIADSVRRWWPDSLPALWAAMGQVLYIAFFLVVHLMKLHSLSLVWGVTTEAMEYEDVARKKSQMDSNKTRLQRLAFVGFGGTVGGILGSGLASSLAQTLRLPGLLVVSAGLLEISAELSIELGLIMKKHWEEQQLFQSNNDLASLDPSMKRSTSLGSMKRVASGNSLNRVKSTSELSRTGPDKSGVVTDDAAGEDSFFQRLLRGVTTILRSRLLMAIFTYNALYASTTVLLSFQRAELVANRNNFTTTEADTAFLANVNMASSIAIFLLQASGSGAYLAHVCGPRGTLTLMPLVRFLGLIALGWWHRASNGKPPNLMVFLVVDECCKIMNLAVAKPVRESLWRGLSNEARYEAKPIVDTLANRWGGGSAAFLVSFIHKTLDVVLGVPAHGAERSLFGFPPMIVLCLTIAAWWTAVSADLGQIRRKIDLELKKRL